MGFEPTPGIVKIPVRHTPSLHKYVESIPRLASRYPQRLDTIYESRPLGARQVGLRCLSMWLLPQPLQGRFALRISSTYLPFTSPHYNRARQQDPRVGVVPETVKLLIGVHYKCNPSLARASSFATGRESPYCFRCSLSNAYTRARLTVFSVFEVGNNHCYFQAQYFTPRLISMPPYAT